MIAITKFSEDRGAVAIIFTILLTSTLILALLTLVYDGGGLHTERKVLQNASDSAVLATAQECATGGTGAISGISSAYPSALCSSNAYAKEFAARYANLNSPDGLSNLDELCGTDALTPCGPKVGGIYDCADVNPKYTHYVRVRASSQQASGNSIKTVFLPLIEQNPGPFSLNSCSQAAWGKARTAPVVLPFALPICSYYLNGTALIRDFDANAPTSPCSVTDENGSTFSYPQPPAGFVLLKNFGCPGITSHPPLFVGTVLEIQPSLQQVEQQCSSASVFFDQLRKYINTPVFLPVVTNVFCGSSNCGQGGYQFKVASFFSFKFLGGHFRNDADLGIGDQPNGSWSSSCDANSSCFYGTFTRSVAPGVDVVIDNPDLPSLGALAVQLLP